MSNHTARRIAGIIGFCGVLFGAFGAHMLHGLLQKNETTGIWETGVLYHLVHALALLTLSGWRPMPHRAFALMLGGLIVFALSSVANQRPMARRDHADRRPRHDGGMAGACPLQARGVVSLESRPSHFSFFRASAR
jgi:Protein of unknown function (DUF423)